MCWQVHGGAPGGKAAVAVCEAALCRGVPAAGLADAAGAAIPDRQRMTTDYLSKPAFASKSG